MSSYRAVLDASALLAFLQGEPGSEGVIEWAGGGVVSAVNWSEAAGKLMDRGVSADAVRSTLELLALDILPFDRDLAYRAATLRKETRSFGLSFGDRACLATAEKHGVPAITADSAWAKLNLPIEIVLVR